MIKVTSKRSAKAKEKRHHYWIHLKVTLLYFVIKVTSKRSAKAKEKRHHHWIHLKVKLTVLVIKVRATFRRG